MFDSAPPTSMAAARVPGFKRSRIDLGVHVLFHFMLFDDEQLVLLPSCASTNASRQPDSSSFPAYR
jgi:hypothetical protein